MLQQINVEVSVESGDLTGVLQVPAQLTDDDITDEIFNQLRDAIISFQIPVKRRTFPKSHKAEGQNWID